MNDTYEQLSPSIPKGGENKIASTVYVENALASLGVIPHMADSHGSGTSPGVLFVKLTGDEAGGGVYTCQVFTNKPGLNNPATGVSSANIEGDRLFENAVYLNLQEVGAGTHDLTNASNTAQRYFIGHFNGYTNETTPRAVFCGNAIWLDTCASSRPGEIVAPVEITEDATLDDTMTTIYVGTTAGDITLTLPAIATIGAYAYTVYNSSGNNVIIDGDGSETVQGVATQTISDGDFLTVTSPGSGTNWF